jgi:GntR family transcriptional regulator of arabinose operon
MQRTSALLKQEEVTAALRARIAGGQYKTGELIPPERSLAGEFQVARPTLRKALDPLIQEGMVVKVPGIGTRVTARENPANGRARWRVLGLLIPDFSNRFFIEVTEAVEYTALRRGYQLLLCNSRHDVGLEDWHLRQLAERQVDGVVVAHDPYTELPRSLVQLEEAAIPFVFLFATPGEAQFDTVALDDRSGVDELMKYLFSLGHRRIAFCRPNEGAKMHPREQAFRGIMEAAGLAVPANCVISQETLISLRSPEMLKRLFSGRNAPTAVFAGNDRTALLLLNRLGHLEISVPGQVSVIGFDNLRFTEDLPVALTTVDQPKQDMGRRAVELLLEKIELGRSNAPRNEIFRPRLVIRASCGIARS